MQVHTIGIGLAKNVFQIFGVNVQGNIVVARRLQRKQLHDKTAPCLIGIEAASP